MGSLSPEWVAVDRHVRKQLFKAALQKSRELTVVFEGADDERNQVEAILRIAKYQQSIGQIRRRYTNIEFAPVVEFLEANFLIRLSLIQALDAYLNCYSGTISNRERQANVSVADASFNDSSADGWTDGFTVSVFVVAEGEFTQRGV